MMQLSEIRDVLHGMIKGDDRPVVIFSALWPLIRSTRLSGAEVCNDLFDMIISLTRDRLLLMPAFPPEPINGVCNLDTAPSTTGELSEKLRTEPGTRRTICAFFPFAVKGPQTNDIIHPPPSEAWGEGSLYHWMYDKDAHIITIGVHPTHCSFTHFAEWLARDIIPYRYNKKFSIDFVHEDKSFSCEQTLLVKKRSPRAVNDFTWLYDTYLAVGMQHRQIDGVNISAISAKNKIGAIMPFIEKDPLALLKNKRDFGGK